MTKKVHKFLRDLARKIRESDDLSSHEIDRAMYEIHPAQHPALRLAAQRGAAFFANELDRIVADDASPAKAEGR